MSNIKPDSIIALLDAPEKMTDVLDASIWASHRLEAPIGLLYSIPSSHRKKAVNYSGCLNMDDEDHMLHEFADEEHTSNLALKEQGKQLLNTAKTYCTEHYCKQSVYTLHRQCSVTDSIDYVDDSAQLIILADETDNRTRLIKRIRVSHCPVLVTPSPFSVPTSALLAFDNRETCHHLLEWLSHSPLARTMLIHIVMIGKDNDTNKDALREGYAKLTQAGIKCKKSLVDSRDVISALLYYQQEHQLDMLISGAFGHSRLHEWIQGSKTEKLLNTHNTAYLLYPKSS